MALLKEDTINGDIPKMTPKNAALICEAGAALFIVKDQIRPGKTPRILTRQATVLKK